MAILAGLASWVIAAPTIKGKNRILKLLLRLVDGQVVTSRYGVKMRVHADDFTNWACISGAYQRDYDDVFAEVSQLEPGMAFVDIGANAGLFSMVAGLRLGPTGVVLAFEPNAKVFAQLIDNSRLNELLNFHPMEAAVGRESGTARFNSGGPQHTGIGQITEQGNEQVDVMSFADRPELAAILGNRRIVIKIDVEGHEGAVIQGLSSLLASPQVEKVVVEIDDANLRTHGSSAGEVYDSMARAGLRSRRGMGTAEHYNEVFFR